MLPLAVVHHYRLRRGGDGGRLPVLFPWRWRRSLHYHGYQERISIDRSRAARRRRRSAGLSCLHWDSTTTPKGSFLHPGEKNEVGIADDLPLPRPPPRWLSLSDDARRRERKRGRSWLACPSRWQHQDDCVVACEGAEEEHLVAWEGEMGDGWSAPPVRCCFRRFLLFVLYSAALDDRVPGKTSTDDWGWVGKGKRTRMTSKTKRRERWPPLP